MDEKEKNQQEEQQEEIVENAENQDVEVVDVPIEEEPAASEVETLRSELAQQKDQYLRQVAEFDNYRKRVTKEKAELIKNGGERVIEALLPVLDDFHRAQEQMDRATDVESVKQGVQLIVDRLKSVLKQQGLAEIEAVGQPFDVDFHEAIQLVPAENDEQKGKVVVCAQSGYKLNDKVIRHAKVVVAQ